MAYPVTINGRTYTLADFEGTNYVDGFPDALEDFVTQAGDIYNSTSTTSNTVGTGSKTFTTADSGKPYQAGTPLRIADAAAPATNWMDCIVTSYSGTTLVVNAFGYAGSGTKTSWNINIGGAKTVDGTLAIAQGGTGATTASAAADNLGLGTGDSPTFAGATLTGDLTIPDKIIHAGDTNTAIRFPANDTVTIETGGSEQFRVDGADVGIGDISPDERLSVAGGNIQLKGTTYTDFSDYWASAGGDNAAIFTPYGYIGSNGGFALSFFSNGYRNNTAGFTSMGINSSSDASGLELLPTGVIQCRTGTPSGTTVPERMRIDSSGKVGIGTTSPLSTLQVNNTGSAFTAAATFRDNGDASSWARVDLAHQSGGGPFIFYQNEAGQCGIRNDSTSATASLEFVAGPTSNPTEVKFFSHFGTERMRIGSGGDVIFGATTAVTAQVGSNVDAFGYDASAGQVAIANDSQNAPQLICNSSNYGSGTAEFVWFRTNGNVTPVGSITYTGTLTAYNTSSDARLKENIEDAGDAGSIVDAIRVRQFDWKESGAHQDYGFVAQELVKHFPDAVSPLGDEDYLGVDNSKLVPLLLKELQSLRARVAELEAKA